jgi:aromatic ring-opening dioxygenase catalytic subunit (LigB family)
MRQKSLFISHGGGPCFWMEAPPPIGPRGFDKLRTHLAGLLGTLPAPPRAIVMVSGHWEAPVPTVNVSAAPGMLFDYTGFPEHTYRLRYPAPGDPALAARVRDLLAAAGIASAEDAGRGFDHGVFVPMLIVDPDARIPLVQISMRQDLNAGFHIDMGRALAPLRDEGVLIIGSGNSYHNLRHFFDGEATASALFDTWLDKAISLQPAAARDASLTHWAEAPSARACHPREDHLIPLMVAAGAAGADTGVRDFHDLIGGKSISGFAFG